MIASHNRALVLNVVALLLLAVAQLVTFGAGGWNPGIIAGTGLVAANLARAYARRS